MGIEKTTPDHFGPPPSTLVAPPPPDARPPSVHETSIYQRPPEHQVEEQPAQVIIPTTVTELFQANVNGNTGNIQTSSTTSKMVEDLYKILTKLAAENKVLKQSVQEQQEIINCEYISTSERRVPEIPLTVSSVQYQQKQKDAGAAGQSSGASGATASAKETKSKLSLTDAVKGKKNKDKNKKQQQQADQDQNEVKEETTIPIEINEADKINSPSEERLADLTRRLESSDMEGQRLADALEQMSAQKSALERDVAALQSDNDRVRANNEVMASEKWEISAANADLQNRLQTVSYMQGVPDTMLQEEVRKLHIAVSDERKVTEKLSRNLELEKRRSESLEQKAKSAFRRSGASSGTAVFLPEELRFRDEQVKESMEKYRDQLERVTRSLQECEEKLTGFEIQEEYHVADLRKELANVKKLIVDEKRRSGSDSQKLNEIQALFGHAIKAYQDSVEHVKQTESKNKHKNNDEHHAEHHHSSSSRSTRDNNSPSKVESLQTKLAQAQEDARDERRRAEQLVEKLNKCQIDLETLPLLQAQVEVYQTDFNAERAAREKIAGEKADLLEQIQRIKGGHQEALHQPQNPDNNVATRARTPPVIATGTVRDAVNHFAAPERYDAPQAQPKGGDRKTFSCPKCNKAFPLLALLQNHVNACLDRD